MDNRALVYYLTMAVPHQKWIYENSNGKIKGPLSTDEILLLISEGELIGTEKIAEYPGGDWASISAIPQFYEALLGEIEKKKDLDINNVGKGEIQHQDPKNLEPNTHKLPKVDKDLPLKEESVVNQPHHVENELEITQSVEAKENRQHKITNNRSIAENTKQSYFDKNKKHRLNSSEIIELKDIDKLVQAKSASSSVLKFIIVCAAVGLIILIFWEDNDNLNNIERIKLLAPQNNKKLNIKKEVISNLFARAVKEIELDSTSQYLVAQNHLVEVIESDPSRMDARGLLCLVYKELWPFTLQGGEELKIVNEFTKITRQIDLSNPVGDICDTVRLLLNGKFGEAKGLLDVALEIESRFSLLPVLYYLKAETLLSYKDTINAFAFYEHSGKLWEGWVAPRRVMANALRLGGRPNDSAIQLKWILKRNPNHKVAKLLLGIIWYRSFKSTQTALPLLQSGIKLKDRISPEIESDAYVSLSEIMLDKGDSKSAKVFAEIGYRRNPTSQIARQLFLRLGGNPRSIASEKGNNELLYLGDQFVRQGDHLSAQAQYKAAFESDPKNATAALRAAKSLWQLNRSHEAIQWLRKAIQADRHLISAQVVLSDYLSQRYDFSGARQVLTEALSIDPRNSEVYKGLANIELRRNNIAGALLYGDKALKLFDGDIELYIILAKANGMLASINAPNKKEQEVKAKAQRDAQIYATKAIELDSLNVEAQITYARLLGQNNGVDVAISYLQEKIRKFSYSIEYRVGLGELLQNEERYSQAKTVFQEVAEADPKNKKAFIGLGLCNKALGLNDAAIKNFLQAAVIDPSDGEPLFHAGILYLELNRSVESIAQLQRVQKVNPNFPKVYYYIGRAYFQMGSFKEALENANQEKKKNPDLADAYILTAEVYEIQKQFAECATEYSAAIKKRHQATATYVRAAQCYRQSGSLDVAENMLERALNIESGFAEIYKEQGALFEMRGDTNAAMAAYNKYLGLSPNAKDRTQIEEKINNLERGGN